MGQGSPEHMSLPLLPATEPRENTLKHSRISGQLRSELPHRFELTLIAHVEIQLLPTGEVVWHLGHEVAHARLE